jgi:Big-like domain-containing protein/centrosomal CEP192-like protein
MPSVPLKSSKRYFVNRCFPLVLTLATVFVPGVVGASGQTVAISTNTFNYGSQVVGTASAAKTVTLKNGQTVALTITSIATNLADYTPSSTCPIKPATLKAGASCTISVVFDPAALGSRPGSLAITDSAGNSPQTVTLIGTGIAPVTATPVAYAFGNEADGKITAAKVITVRNNQAVPLTITSVGTNLAIYPTTTTCPISPTTLPAGSTCTVSVSFAPLVAGSSSAVLTIANNASGSPTVSLTGTGIVPVTVSPATLSFGSQAKGTTSAAQSVILTNNQSGTLNISGITSSLSDFAVASTACPISPNLLAGGASCSTSVTFSPSATGSRTGTLSFKGNATNSPQKVSLSGTGVAAALVSIAVTPSPASVAAGQTVQFSATGTYSDSSTKNLTSSVTWTSSAPTVATVNAGGLASGLSAGSATIGATLGSVTGSTNLVVGQPTLVSIAVTPASPSFALGTTQQLQAVGTYTDGSTVNITSSVSWSVGTANIATVNSQGLVSSSAVGSSSVVAASGAVSGSTVVNITPAVLISITVTPAIPTIPLGVSQQFTATGTFSDSSTQNLTQTVQWSSDTPSTATISNVGGTQGLVTSAGTGTATISASSGSIKGSTTLTVTAAALVSITVAPANPSIALGTTQQFTATGSFTDNSTMDLTATATWSSDTPGTATINNAGLASSAGSGTANITATSGAISGSTTLTVTPAVLVSIAINPASASIALGTTQTFTALGTYSDGTTQDLTQSGYWTSSNAAAATISDSPPTQGVASTVAPGSTSISVAVGAVTASAVLAVTPAALLSIAINPSSPSIPLGTTQQFSATGTYTDGTTQNLTSTAQWSSSSAAVAVVNAAGLATSSGTGTATITAASGSVTSSMPLTVGSPGLVSIAVTPNSAVVPAGFTQQFQAVGTYTDGSTQNLTASVAWSSDTPAVVTVAPAGLATALSAGSANIFATSGTIAGSTPFSVSSPVLMSLSLSPSGISIPLGTTQQFVVIGTFSDGSTLNLTNSVSWNSSTPGIVSISATGLAAGVATGSVTIATTMGSITSTTSLAVGGPALVSIAVTPANSSIPLGLTQPLIATGTYTDGSTQNLTSAVTWLSSNPAIATINFQGLVLSVAAGAVNVSATSGPIAGSTGLTVTPPTLVAITVSPSAASIFLGATQQFAATGSYTDGSTANLTSSVLWSSSAPSVATVSSAGLAASATIGGANITASLGSITGEAPLMIAQPPLTAISITQNTSFALGTTQQLQATGTYVGGSTQNISNSVNWSEANNAVVSVNSSGLATGLGIGSTTVSASSGSISGSAPIAVTLGPVPPTFFGMQFNSPTSTVTAPYGTCRIWGVLGTLWADIEPSPGVYQFATLDGILANAKQAGINDGCVFTFGYFPQWASTNPTDNTCDELNSTTGSCWPPADLNFDGSGTDQTVVSAITAIATHLNDPVYLQTHAHIRYWEPFNEPYSSSTLSGTVCTTTHTCSFNGSYAQLVRMAEDMRCVIKGMGTVNGVPCTNIAIDPTASITTPSGQSYFQMNGRLVVANFLQCNQKPLAGSGCTTGARGSAATDVVDFHCYVFSGNPDDATANIAASRAVLTSTDAAKPFICGEGSWGTPSDLADPNLQAGFVARWFTDILNQQVTTTIWYEWDNQAWGTLWNPKGKSGCTQAPGCITEAGTAYAQTYSWLAGHTLQGCQNSGGVNVCTLTGPNGYSALMVWVTTALSTCTGQSNAEVCGSTLYLVPSGYVIKHYLDGSSQPASASEYIGAKPVLLSNQ